MSAFISELKENYADLSKGLYPLVDSWFLMGHPALIVMITAVYLVFVLKIGPALMANRKPMELHKTMIAYNAFQIVFSLFQFYKSVSSEYRGWIFTFKCGTVDVHSEMHKRFLDAAWFYMFSKVIELLDTVFFVLRKKQKQVSFLHIFHHSNMLFFTWMYLKYAAGPQGLMIGIVNSLVHVIMYTYYLLAGLGPRFQKFLWWKHYVTRIQLFQFVFILTFLLLTSLSSCPFPKNITVFFFCNTVIFLVLFLNFYRKTYKSKNTLKAIDEMTKQKQY